MKKLYVLGRVRAKGEYGLIVVGILLNVQPELTSGVKIEYYDCTQPFEVHTYDRKSFCTIPERVYALYQIQD